MTRPRIALEILVIVLLGTLIATALPGCTDIDRATLAEAVATLDAEIAKLPEGDPARTEYESKRAQLLKALAAADAVSTGDFSALAQYGNIGAYLGLALALAWKIKQSSDRRTALKTVVKSVDAAFPDRTAEQKDLLSTVQGPAVSAKVDKIKSNL